MKNIAYHVIAEINNLSHVRDNIWKNQKNETFYLDRFGFHTALQESNFRILQKEYEINKIARSYNEFIKILTAQSVGNNKKRNRINQVLDSDISNDDKINIISEVYKSNNNLKS
jgi:hypothetical protein